MLLLKILFFILLTHSEKFNSSHLMVYFQEVAVTLEQYDIIRLATSFRIITSTTTTSTTGLNNTVYLTYMNTINIQKYQQNIR